MPMRLVQQTAAPPPPALPETPVAPRAPTPQEVRLRVDEHVRQTAEQARAAARDARAAARQAVIHAGAQAPSAPSAPGTTTTAQGDLPFDPNMIAPIAEYAVTAFFVTLAFMVVMLPVARAFARRLDRAPAPPAIAPQVAEQLTRIEHTVESMAIEIERISESQRFLTKVQAAKSEPLALPPRPAAGA
jgi:hypothetical protein